MTLKELIQSNDRGYDVCDDIFDWGVFIDYDYDTELENYYDKALDFMANEIKVVKVKSGWGNFTVCKFSEFVVKYQDVFDKFLNEENKEEYTPKYACEKLAVDKLNPDMEEFCDVYLTSLECLITGDYSESEYKKLYKMLKEKRA